MRLPRRFSNSGSVVATLPMVGEAILVNTLWVSIVEQGRNSPIFGPHAHASTAKSAQDQDLS